MVRMIPAEPRAEANRSEQALFSALQAITDRPDWIAIHSLVLGQNIRNITGEADFIVLVPEKGILVIEAKNPNSVVYKNGNWYLDGTPHPKKDPLKQLDDARRNIRAYLKRNDLFDEAPMPRLLWFTSLGRYDLDVKTPGDMQFFEWELAWGDDLEKPAKTIEKTLQESIKWFAENENISFKTAEFTQEVADSISDQLLRDFEATRGPKDRRRDRVKTRNRLAEEQLTILSVFESNPHIFLSGSAGTGKSFLLQEAARRLSKSGNRTLVTCWNEMMAEETNLQVGGRDNVVCKDLGSLLLEIVGLAGHPDDADSTWFQKTLPEKALAMLKKYPALGNFDAICVDEFQDIASNILLLECLFELTKTKKPEGSKLIFAGDGLQQIMVDGKKQVNPFERAKILIPDLTHITLKTNFRNAPNLALQLPNLTGLKIEVESYRLPADTEGGFQVIEYSEKGQTKELARILKELLKEFSPEDIRILSPFGKTSLISEMMKRTAESDAERYLKSVLRYMRNPGIRWRSISKFKGLESDIVVITDIDARAKEFYEGMNQTLGDALYVGASRARYWCILLVGNEVIKFQPRKVIGSI